MGREQLIHGITSCRYHRRLDEGLFSAE